MIHTITRAAFNEWAATHGSTLSDLYGVDLEPDENWFDEIMGITFTGDTSDGLISDMTALGFARVDDDTITYDDARHDDLVRCFDRVRDEEMHGDDSTPELREATMPTWVRYDIHHDDDEDYNSGLPGIGLDAICAFISGEAPA